MKFKYSVIGDNTQENREWLEKVGYKLENQHEDGKYLVTHLRLHNDTPLYWCAVPLNQDMHIGSINCIGNSPLFKAVSAMREDSDFGQLFECKDGLLICQYPTSREHINKECKGWDVTGLKKYTLTELQERFKID